MNTYICIYIKNTPITHLILVIKFHAIIDSNIYNQLYVNIINKLDVFINEGV